MSPDDLMSKDELSANLYMWLTLDRDEIWQWYRALALTEEIPGVQSL